MTNWKVTSQMVWKTAKETAQSLGVSRRRVCQLAEAGRFGPNAYKKYDKSGNYNGAWMIRFPNDYQKRSEGRPRKDEEILVEL